MNRTSDVNAHRILAAESRATIEANITLRSQPVVEEVLKM
jgi:hypothetical protein